MPIPEVFVTEKKQAKRSNMMRGPRASAPTTELALSPADQAVQGANSRTSKSGPRPDPGNLQLSLTRYITPSTLSERL